MISKQHPATHVVALATILGTGIWACGAPNGDQLMGGPGSSDIPGATEAGADGGLPGTNADGGADGSGDAQPAIPFEPVGPVSYVPKVKNLMTGLAATDAEVQAVVKDPTALRGLIDGWMMLPEFQGRMLEFFRNGFQQNQVTLPQLMTNMGMNLPFNNTYQARFERSLMDSFPRTVWELIQEGRPFNEAITTHRYMLTTAMLSFLAYADEENVSDTNKTTDRLTQRSALTSFTMDPTSTATLVETLDPTNAKYMVWPTLVTIPAACTPTPFVITAASNYKSLFGILFGQNAYTPCYPMGSQNFPSQFTDADWADWHMVTLHTTDATTPNTTPVFYDILKLRAATDVTLHTPRMGFFGTPAFAANWGTNATNEGRVTANQSLIVSIGQSIDGENVITTFPVNATDANHASDPACSGCHSQLDPFKQYFRQSYSLSYDDQTDTTQLAQAAGFSIDGVMAKGQGVGDLATVLSTHPRFPLAWVLKLHFWANSTAAMESDPEVTRIASAFQASQFDFKTLVRELFSSPLITFAAGTQTTETQGVILSISRRDQYCASLSNRLGLPDVCGMETPKLTSAQSTVSARALLMPVDTYYRAYALPSLPTNPDLFFRDSTEAMCRLIADQVVDVKPTSRYTSTTPDVAITDFVATVMGIVPSDPRAAQAQVILKDNYTSALAGGANATDSLKSTFTLACIAPSSVIVGL